MSDAPSPRSFSPLWFLALLPVGLGAGWLIGKLPEPAAKPPVEAVRTAPAAVALPADAQTVRDGSSPSFGLPASPDPARATADAPREIVSPWTTPDGALLESRSNGKAILLDFNAEWCPPCQRLKSELFDSAILGRQVQAAVIPVSVVDRKREEGQNAPQVEGMQEQFEVKAFPTLVVFSPHTGRRLTKTGYSGAEATLAWIQQAAAAVQ